jgi:uncharacterized protein (DUF2164 family)
MTASSRTTSTLGAVVLSEMPAGESFTPQPWVWSLTTQDMAPQRCRAIFAVTSHRRPARIRGVPKSDRPSSVMRIKLSPERRSMLVDAIKRHFDAEFDEPLSDFRAEQLLDLFVAELGPPVYNQGVRDASSYIADKLIDIEGDVFEVEAQ